MTADAAVDEVALGSRLGSVAAEQDDRGLGQHGGSWEMVTFHVVLVVVPLVAVLPVAVLLAEALGAEDQQGQTDQGRWSVDEEVPDMCVESLVWGSQVVVECVV